MSDELPSFMSLFIIYRYCIPKSEETKFKDALEELVPDLVDPDSPIWLPEDAIMVSRFHYFIQSIDQ